MNNGTKRGVTGIAVVLAATVGVTTACLGGPSGLSGNPSGCPGPPYPDATSSPYVLPYAAGTEWSTGLTNCSSSFHAGGQPDQYAFDFDMAVGTPFIASRGGTVYEVVNGEPSGGGGGGNFVTIDHGDGTYGMYLHSPAGGISVAVGETVSQGDVLGETGRSGLAGYPHLHFIVVEGDPTWPYTGVPVSFRNASPAHGVLRGLTTYLALPG